MWTHKDYMSFIYLILFFSIRTAYGSLPKDGVYFFVSEYNPRCFYEELPGETILKGDYNYEFSEKKPLKILVSDPNGSIVVDKPISGTGRFAHPSTEAGLHKICVVADPATPWPSADKTSKFQLQIELQAKETPEFEDLAKKSHLTSLQRELHELEMKLNYILSELEYSEGQEGHFRDQSERINSRIIFWSILQITLLVVSGIWQIVHLQSFFRAKKLV